MALAFPGSWEGPDGKQTSKPPDVCRAIDHLPQQQPLLPCCRGNFSLDSSHSPPLSPRSRAPRICKGRPDRARVGAGGAVGGHGHGWLVVKTRELGMQGWDFDPGESSRWPPSFLYQHRFTAQLGKEWEAERRIFLHYRSLVLFPLALICSSPWKGRCLGLRGELVCDLGQVTSSFQALLSCSVKSPFQFRSLDANPLLLLLLPEAL